MGEATKVLKKGAYHHGDLRQELVKALRILIEEQGATGFSVSEACRRAGVSTAAPYRHFTDRDDMLKAVATDAKLRMAEAFRAAADKHTLGSPEAMFAIGRAYVDFAIAQPNVFRLAFSLKDDEGTPLCEAGDRCHFEVARQMSAFLGKPVDDPEVTQKAFPLWAFVHGLSFMAIDDVMEKAGIDANLDALIWEAGNRLLGRGTDLPPPTP